MKLLFDENRSPDLAPLLADLFPESISASQLAPKPVSDQTIWELSRAGGYAIISKDSDFEPLVLLRGHPPKLVWVRCGNVRSWKPSDTFALMVEESLNFSRMTSRRCW